MDLSLGAIPRWLDRWQPSESMVQGGVAVLVGLGSGVGVWVFEYLIEFFHTVAFEEIGDRLSRIGSWTVFLLPVMGGLAVGLLLHFFIGQERHHGVAGIMEAVALAGGRLRYNRIPIKSVAAALGIGFGGSVGPEDPSVQIGANVGSFIGQKFHFSEGATRSLVAAGGASGIASAFNAPIAGIFFALEVILGEISSRAFGVVTLAAVVAAVFTQAISGPQPAFQVPPYAFNSMWELPLYIGLGVLAGPVSALYVRLIYRAQDTFHTIALPRWLKPALAGLIVGLAGIFLPDLFGVGYRAIEAVLLNSHSFTLALILALLLGKLVLTPVSVGGGFPGGVFAPSLFVGAMLGGAYGLLAGWLFPHIPITPAAFAMVGMASVLSGAVHAPLTAILLLFEMTNNYRIILPLMMAVTLSTLISQWFSRDSVYTLGLARKGIRLERGRDVEVLESITVGEVMQPAPLTFREQDTLETAARIFFETHHHGLPVLNDRGALVGIFTLQDLERARSETDNPGLTVGEVCTRDLLTAQTDETLGAALRRMGSRDIGRLLVVPAGDPHRLLGLLRRGDIVRAYEVALTRRAALRHQAHQVRLAAFGQVEVIELTVAPKAACAGQRISDIKWPPNTVITSIRRGRQVIIPHGHTVLQPGDVLAIVVEGSVPADLGQICTVPL